MTSRILVTAFLFAAVLATPAAAHHSISAQFDSNRQITISGIVSNVDWMNPHTYVFVDVKDPGVAKARTWACELASPNELARRGFTRASLKIGMTVRVMGARAKDGSFKVHIEELSADNGAILVK